MGEVQIGKSEVSTSVVNWSEGLSNRVTIIVRRYIDQMNFAAYRGVFYVYGSVHHNLFF